MEKKFEINLEDFINKIINICRSVTPLQNMSKNDVLVSYSKGEVHHIWLHYNGEVISHRVAYEKRFRDKDYSLNHYIWYSDKGWTFVGTLKGELIKNFKPKKL